jgi:lipopolysaccharide transport system ATP-binding protein
MPPQQPMVEVSGIGKKFARSLRASLRYGLVDIGRDLLLQDGSTPSLRPGEFWAVDDVSFTARPGEALAVIGRNGSGKSTLLKMLHGLVKPDAGGITIRGRLAAMIELGAGFDPLLTGRENALLGGSLTGIGGEEMAELIPAIADFSGLADVLDTPVKFYSSGMRARLAYSIAASVSPDIFLVDEVLAVGDADFRQKCLHNMSAFVENGGILIFVSHVAQQIQAVCNRGVVLESGRLVHEGTALEALDDYYRRELERPRERAADSGPAPDPRVRIIAMTARADDDASAIRTGGRIAIELACECRERVDLSGTITILGRDVSTVVAIEHSGPPRRCDPGRHVFRFHIPSLPLMPGLFHLRAGLREGERQIPVATFGLDQAPARLVVGGEPTWPAVRALATGQLVRIEGAWS